MTLPKYMYSDMAEIETGSKMLIRRTFVFPIRKSLYRSCGLSYNLYNVKCTKVSPTYQYSLVMPNVQMILSLVYQMHPVYQTYILYEVYRKMANNDPSVPKNYLVYQLV